MEKLCSIVVLLIAIFTFSSCSGDDDRVDLSGKYISDEAGITKIYTLEMTSEFAFWYQYNEGKEVAYDSFMYKVAGDSIRVIAPYEIVPHKSAYSARDNVLIFEGITYRKVPSETFSSLAGHTYVAADWESSTHNLLYDIYEFHADGTYSVDIRMGRITGRQYGTNRGVYTKPDSSMYFSLGRNDKPAFLSSDYKSFYYSIYDVSISRYRTLIFYAYK